MEASAAPSPSPSAQAPMTPNGTNRRPSRKSTLTQQQKNQKRQRATQDQLITLEVEFNKNPTPTALVRERIAQDINMTERSVQIWFQNRRAKIKNIAKKSIESGEDCDGIPESMRRYLAIQAMESGKGFGQELLARNGSIGGYGGGSMLLNTDSASSKVVIHHFSCRSLGIGSWQRVGQSAMDLVIFYSPDKCCVTYYINNDSAGYKIEYPFSYIKNISLENGDPVCNAEGAAQRPGGLIVELNRPPNFFMDSSGSGGFYQCGDFTEEQQASRIMVHHLGGHPKVLSGQLAKLVSLDTFQKRHHMPDPNAIALSAPVSPIMHRPASQPNQFARPNLPMYQRGPYGDSLQPGRGHKRQRSRSVPVAVDFNMLRAPMPSFLIQHDQGHGSFTPSPHQSQHNAEIFAPIPQHHGVQVGQGNGPNLSIDTSATYGMEFKPYPASSTTANSPSEFGTPAFFTGAQVGDTVSTAGLNTPYSMAPFMSPMGTDPSSGVPQSSVSPMPMGAVPHQQQQQQQQQQQHHHADPVIANQSPPLSSLGRSDTADFYSMSHDHVGGEDGLSLNDMYSKQVMSLPFRNPLGHPDDGSDDLDMQNLIAFNNTIDPASLSPEKSL